VTVPVQVPDVDQLHPTSASQVVEFVFEAQAWMVPVQAPFQVHPETA
jgi:hypothetical protein